MFLQYVRVRKKARVLHLPSSGVRAQCVFVCKKIMSKKLMLEIAIKCVYEVFSITTATRIRFYTLRKTDESG